VYWVVAHISVKRVVAHRSVKKNIMLTGIFFILGLFKKIQK
jgi:hypothetical protein